MFTGATARLTVQNCGETPLQLAVEPWADEHRLPPGQTCVVVTHAPRADGSWCGTTRKNEPFHVEHRQDSIVVWAHGYCFHLSDLAGGEIYAADRECPAQSSAP
ncbi:hypothetical protein AB0I28_15785 [Phytomonospora sp. NPDC050363]|uniref:hypothetical protein n=1 Tax=Phytomonospora sp. NPDC050363 TaxID=3155642 RepID=UPI0034000EBF